MFGKKKKKSNLEKIYEQNNKLVLRQSLFEKQYYDKAAELERKRNFGKEYVR